MCAGESGELNGLGDWARYIRRHPEMRRAVLAAGRDGLKPEEVLALLKLILSEFEDAATLREEHSDEEIYREFRRELAAETVWTWHIY